MNIVTQYCAFKRYNINFKSLHKTTSFLLITNLLPGSPFLFLLSSCTSSFRANRSYLVRSGPIKTFPYLSQPLSSLARYNNCCADAAFSTLKTHKNGASSPSHSQVTKFAECVKYLDYFDPP